MVLRNTGGADVIARPDEQDRAKSVGGRSRAEPGLGSLAVSLLRGALGGDVAKFAKEVDARSS